MAMQVLARLCSAFIGACLLLSISQSCATQNEGERCDIKNYSADCDDGLTCTPIGDATGSYAVCCWALGSGHQNTSAPCIQNPTSGTGGRPNTADAGDDAPDGGSADTGTAE
jgi:hypothetical protein